jgi:hypothetical protein
LNQDFAKIFVFGQISNTQGSFLINKLVLKISQNGNVWAICANIFAKMSISAGTKFGEIIQEILHFCEHGKRYFRFNPKYIPMPDPDRH